jgi:hypothetical protein
MKTAHEFTSQKILPHGFDIENGTAHVAPSLSPEALNSNEFRKQYKFLFSPEHLSLIQSTYLGDRDPRQDSLNKYPAHAAMLQVIPQNDEKRTGLDNTIMRNALNTYITNFSNMWKSVRRLKKIFNKLILVLLRLHLARE